MEQHRGSMPLPLIFILVTVALDAIGIGLIIPVMPDLLREIGGGTLAEAAVWGGILSTSYAAMQFLFGPAMGALSDRVGRRPAGRRPRRRCSRTPSRRTDR